MVWVQRLALPHVAPVTFATRTLLRYEVVRNEKRVATLLLVVNDAALAKGRTEVVLTVMCTPHSREGVSESSVLRRVRILASRMRT